MAKSIFTTSLISLLLCRLCVAAGEPVGDRITVTVRGKGPEVVLLPGLGCSNAVWEATAKRLEGSYRLHLVQVAGFAGAPAGANARGPVLQPTVEALDAYIKTNKLKSPSLIGHSLGGLMGLMLAAQHPEDASRLMVVDSLPFFSVIMGCTNVTQATPRATAMRDSLMNQTQEEYAQGEEAFLRMLVKSSDGLKLATRWAVASDKSVFARALYDDMVTDLRPRLHDIQVPITVIYAWDPGTGFPQAATDALYRESFAPLPSKKLVRIDNSLHFIMFDQPEVFAVQVDAFLK